MRDGDGFYSLSRKHSNDMATSFMQLQKERQSNNPTCEYVLFLFKTGFHLTEVLQKSTNFLIQ